MNTHISASAPACAVWDFTTGDAKIFLDRINLILDADKSFREAGVRPQFVVLLRGAVMKFVVRDLSLTVFAAETVENLFEIHQRLAALSQTGAVLEVCEIAMERRGITPGNLLPICRTERNVFVSSVALQNKGYALMRVD